MIPLMQVGRFFREHKHFENPWRSASLSASCCATSRGEWPSGACRSCHAAFI